MVVLLSIENDSLKEQLAAFTDPQEPPSEPTDFFNKKPPLNAQEPSDEPPTESPLWPPAPSGEYAHLFPDLYAVVPQSEIEHYEENPHYIYMTFDDGPNYMTRAILDHLQKTDIKATFFVVPSESRAGLLRQIRDEGHAIGVHSYSHAFTEVYSSVEAYLEDFHKARELIYEQTGIWSDFFRFPGGSRNDYNKEVRADIITEMHRRGFVYFDWNVDSNDVRGATHDTMLREVRLEIAANFERGERSIVLFHDAATYTSWVVGNLIEKLQESTTPYEFRTINMNTKPHMWHGS